MKLHVINNDKIIMYNIILSLILGYNKSMVIWINAGQKKCKTGSCIGISLKWKVIVFI